MSTTHTIHPIKGTEFDVISQETGAECGWPRLSLTRPFEQDSLLCHFLDSLVVRTHLLKNLVKPSSYEDNILVQVRHELASFNAGCNRRSVYWKTAAWTQAYRIESLLLLAEPADRLVPELEYRLGVAEDYGVNDTSGLRRAFQQATSNKNVESEKIKSSELELEGNLRSILVETVTRTQWQMIKKYLSKILLKVATRNIVFAAMLSFGIFIGPYLYIYFAYYRSPGTLNVLIHQWVAFPLLTCLSAGLFGSYFSRLLYIQKNSKTLNYDDLLSALEVFAIVVRGAVGVCGAALLFFFLHSGLLLGPLVPNIQNALVVLDQKEEFPQLLIANTHLALLVIWGFFAGFSERLVPSILATTEEGLLITGSKTGVAPKQPGAKPAA
jgi:hypothetical protein